MAQTLLTYTTLVQNEVDDTSSAAQSVIQQQLKESYQEVMRQAGVYLKSLTTEDETVVIGQNAYPTATEAVRLYQVAYKPVGTDNFQVLTETSHDKYLDYYINRDNSTPSHFFYDGTTVNIAPAPDELGTLRKVYQPYIAELTGDSIVPDRYTRVVILGAIYRFKFWEDNFAGGQTYKMLFDQALRDMILELATKSVGSKKMSL